MITNKATPWNDEFLQNVLLETIHNPDQTKALLFIYENGIVNIKMIESNEEENLSVYNSACIDAEVIGEDTQSFDASYFESYKQ